MYEVMAINRINQFKVWAFDTLRQARMYCVYLDWCIKVTEDRHVDGEPDEEWMVSYELEIWKDGKRVDRQEF